MRKLRDLGLTYEEAAHGIQSAVRYIMTQRGIPDDSADEVLRMLKHCRVGIDMRASDEQGLATLLIAKGVFTADEYVEHMRLAANEELAYQQDYVRKEFNLPDWAEFR